MKKYIKTFENYNVSNKYCELADKIDTFLDIYASIRPDYDPEYDEEYEKFTGPDSENLYSCSCRLKDGTIPTMCDSSWESGCYAPYNSKEGRLMHDELIAEIKSLNK